MKKYLILFVVLFLSACVSKNSENTSYSIISGKINMIGTSDYNNVKITILNEVSQRSYEMSPDIDGKYTLNNLMGGKYIVKVKYTEGYDEITIAVLLRGGKFIVKDVNIAAFNNIDDILINIRGYKVLNLKNRNENTVLRIEPGREVSYSVSVKYTYNGSAEQMDITGLLEGNTSYFMKNVNLGVKLETDTPDTLELKNGKMYTYNNNRKEPVVLSCTFGNKEIIQKIKVDNITETSDVKLNSMEFDSMQRYDEAEGYIQTSDGESTNVSIYALLQNSTEDMLKNISNDCNITVEKSEMEYIIDKSSNLITITPLKIGRLQFTAEYKGKKLNIPLMVSSKPTEKSVKDYYGRDVAELSMIGDYTGTELYNPMNEDRKMVSSASGIFAKNIEIYKKGTYQFRFVGIDNAGKIVNYGYNGISDQEFANNNIYILKYMDVGKYNILIDVVNRKIQYVYEAKTENRVWSAKYNLTAKSTTISAIEKMFYFPDENKIATIENSYYLEWDLETMKKTGGFELDYSIEPVISGDGKRIAWIDSNKVLFVRDIQTGKILTEIKVGDMVNNSTLLFSTDKKSIYYLSNSSREYDIETGKIVREIKNTNKNSMFSEIINNGKEIINAGNNEVEKIDILTGETKTSLTTTITSIVMSPDMSKFAIVGPIVSGFKYSVSIYNTETFKRIVNFEKGFTNLVCFSPDGKRIASQEDEKLVVYDSETGKFLCETKYDTDIIKCIEFTKDGKGLITCGENGRGGIKVYKSENLSLISQISGHRDIIGSVVMDKTESTAYSISYDGIIRKWSCNTGEFIGAIKEVDNFKSNINDSDAFINSILINKSGDKIYTSNFNGAIKEFDTVTGEKTKELLGGNTKANIRVMAFGNEEKYLITGNEYGEGNIVEISTGNVKNYKKNMLGKIISERLLVDVKRVVFGDTAGTICIWNSETGDVEKTIKSDGGDVFSLAITDNGKNILSGSKDGQIRVWEIESGTMVSKIAVHSAGVNEIVFRDNGKIAITASDDGTIKIWNTENWTLVNTLYGNCNSISVSQDGGVIVGGGAERAFMVWHRE